MKKREWKSRTKRDLMIEVWEHLDGGTVGARELEAVAEAVRERFGEGAVESPAAIARLLADEGAELRHSEVQQARYRRGASAPAGRRGRGTSPLGSPRGGRALARR